MLTRRRVLVAVLVVILFAGIAAARVLRLPALAHLGAGYSAQVVCGCLFVSGRSLESCRGDLDALAQKVVMLSAGEHEVTARALLLGTATARYDATFGCTLVD